MLPPPPPPLLLLLLLLLLLWLLLLLLRQACVEQRLKSDTRVGGTRRLALSVGVKM